MGSYERMCRQLKSTGLYRLDGTTTVEKELYCYGRYFDIIESALDKVIKNRFPETALSNFLEKYQVLYGFKVDLPLDKLREAVSLRQKITDNDFTEEGVLKCLKAGGITASLQKTAGTNNLTVNVISDDGIFGTAIESDRYIMSCMPCSLKVSISR